MGKAHFCLPLEFLLANPLLAVARPRLDVPYLVSPPPIRCHASMDGAIVYQTLAVHRLHGQRGQTNCRLDGYISDDDNDLGASP